MRQARHLPTILFLSKCIIVQYNFSDEILFASYFKDPNINSFTVAIWNIKPKLKYGTT